MSGFVYRVRVGDSVLIKKEIPGPDTIDEFLYEINALSRLEFSEHVIDFHGIVVDDDGQFVKGLLISFAEKGALIDILFEHGKELKADIPWVTRAKWARQIIHGLADIHESGFVQGDFTLSNIVVDEDDDAKIIDINRRGCPVGWEPPEVTPLTESGQRIFMYIGTKSDIYQLGMVLWALAMQDDEPESRRRERPLSLPPSVSIPRWYRFAVTSCLSEDPRKRLHASHLLRLVAEPRLAAPDTGSRTGVAPIRASSTDRARGRSPPNSAAGEYSRHAARQPASSYGSLQHEAAGRPDAATGIRSGLDHGGKRKSPPPGHAINSSKTSEQDRDAAHDTAMRNGHTTEASLGGAARSRSVSNVSAGTTAKSLEEEQENGARRNMTIPEALHESGPRQSAVRTSLGSEKNRSGSRPRDRGSWPQTCDDQSRTRSTFVKSTFMNSLTPTPISWPRHGTWPAAPPACGGQANGQANELLLGMGSVHDATQLSTETLYRGSHLAIESDDDEEMALETTRDTT